MRTYLHTHAHIHVRTPCTTHHTLARQLLHMHARMYVCTHGRTCPSTNTAPRRPTHLPTPAHSQELGLLVSASPTSNPMEVGYSRATPGKCYIRMCIQVACAFVCMHVRVYDGLYSHRGEATDRGWPETYQRWYAKRLIRVYHSKLHEEHRTPPQGCIFRRVSIWPASR